MSVANLDPRIKTTLIKNKNITLIEIKNSYIVAYNRAIVLMCDGHVNVEFVYLISKIYLQVRHKSDHAYVEITNKDSNAVEYNKFKQYFKINYRASIKDFMTITGQPLIRFFHVLRKLLVHLPVEQMIYYNKKYDVTAALAGGLHKENKLKLCAKVPEALRFTYPKVISKYRFGHIAKRVKRVYKRKRTLTHLY